VATLPYGVIAEGYSKSSDRKDRKDQQALLVLEL